MFLTFNFLSKNLPRKSHTNTHSCNNLIFKVNFPSKNKSNYIRIFTVGCRTYILICKLYSIHEFVVPVHTDVLHQN